VPPAENYPLSGPGYHRKYNTVAHQNLDDESEVRDVTPTMYAILDALIDEAVRSLRPYPVDLPPDKAAALAGDALNRIDCILLHHGFVYPGHGEVLLLSDGLAPTMYHGRSLLELADESHNIRRETFIKARGPGPFYVIDCDIASFIYLAIAEVMGYPRIS
jgi:hypothetical protein